MTGITWPHVQTILRNFFLVFSVEELGKAANLFVVLLIETVFHDLAHEVEHLLNLSLFADLVSLLIE